MRISDWSSDVCSSDLVAHELARLGGVPHDPHLLRRAKATPSLRGRGRRERERIVAGAFALAKDAKARATGRHLILIDDEIGRASCRERVWQSVEIPVVADALKKNK